MIVNRESNAKIYRVLQLLHTGTQYVELYYRTACKRSDQETF